MASAESAGAFSDTSPSSLIIVPKPRLVTEKGHLRITDRHLNFVTQASNPHTPSSPQNLRFIVDKDDTYGAPNIVGVENLHTQYREDKRLRVHETPFEVRCSVVLAAMRFIEC